MKHYIFHFNQRIPTLRNLIAEVAGSEVMDVAVAVAVGFAASTWPGSPSPSLPPRSPMLTSQNATCGHGFNIVSTIMMVMVLMVKHGFNVDFING